MDFLMMWLMKHSEGIKDGDILEYQIDHDGVYKVYVDRGAGMQRESSLDGHILILEEQPELYGHDIEAYSEIVTVT